MSDERPTIEVLEGGPLLVKNLDKLTGADGRPIEKPVEREDGERNLFALCRCGGSANKPFCDGTHKENGFSGERGSPEEEEVRVCEGQELTIVDNVGACCHAGECVDGAPEVFFRWEGDERRAVPDADDRQRIIDTIRRCPSGSLAYRLGDELHDEYFSEAEIFVSEDGPLHVRGGPGLVDASGATPVSKDHFALCRCGASKNKPFCDGAHRDAGFTG